MVRGNRFRVARLRTLACGALLTVLAPGLSAQNPRGSLRGIVEDPSGDRIVGATVEVVPWGGTAARRGTSDPRGEFRLDDFLPGLYAVKVSAPGFADATAEVAIAVAAVRDLRVKLTPRVPGEEVTVEGGVSSITTQPLDLATAVHQATVTREDLETIPLPARSFANIAYLAPGTEPVEPSDPTKARITAVSTGGSSGLNNELSVDGADNSDDYIGGFLQNISPDAIQEFAVRTAQADADTGGTTAGSVVITTRRGGNEWHGEAGFYERAAALNARFPIENPPETCTAEGCVPNPKQPFSRQNYVASVGGPIAKDKLSVFAALEIVHEDASIAYSPASTSEFQALAGLAAANLIPGVSSIEVPQSVPVPFRDYNGSLRLDLQESPTSHWFLRVSGDNYTTHNALVQQGALPNTGLLTHNTYWNGVLSNQHVFGPSWLGTLVLGASYLHLTQTRNSDLGFALAFPFTSTSQTVSGFETFGDNQFMTPITLFPSVRTQEKYQLRYDLSHQAPSHSSKFGVNLIHEPVLSGSFPGNAENLTVFVQDPTGYAALIAQNPAQGRAQFTADLTCTPVTIPGASGGVVEPTPNTGCTQTGASNGSFSQNVQRLALYAEDSWRASPHLTINYGLRYQTSFGLFLGSGRSQLENPAYLTLQALQIPLVTGAPHDDRGQIAPRLGIAYSPGASGRDVIRGGVGFFYNDLAQNGWATAFQAVNQPAGTCTLVGAGASAALVGPACLPGSASGGTGNIIGSNYKTPYAIHMTGGIQHAFSSRWMGSLDLVREQGYHGYRAYSYTGGQNLFTPLLPESDAVGQANLVPDMNVFNSDNRSTYNALMVHVQGNVTNQFNLVANYTLSSAKTWGCVLGELFDYVNGVCDPLHPFAPGDYGPSGEDVTHRFVLAGTLHAPLGIELSTLVQAESARPFTITTADGTGRISINGVPESLDEVRGTPYIQVDLRVSRPFRLGSRGTINPFVEFFNLFNRNNPGANYVTNIALLPVPPAQAQSGNITSVCLDPGCSAVQPITSINQLRVPAGGLGDFFGPGTTVGTPFAAQLGVKLSF
jgi:hypothetical protein